MAKKKSTVKGNKKQATKKVAKKSVVKKAAKKQLQQAPQSKTAAKKKPAVKKSSASNAKKSGKAPIKVKAASKKVKAEKKNIAAKTSKPHKQSPKPTANITTDTIMRNQSSYDMLRQDIISNLWKFEEITREGLIDVLQNIHGKNFISGSLDFVQSVIDELIRIDLIEIFNKEDGVSLIRIRQRLSDNN
jgi:hypothetical protein